MQESSDNDYTRRVFKPARGKKFIVVIIIHSVKGVKNQYFLTE